MILPDDFVSQFKTLPGLATENFFNSLDEPAPVSIRLNKPKTTYNPEILNGNFHSNVPWAENGIYLNTRPSFTFDPSFHSGSYYVQEASSMFLEQVLKQIFETTEFRDSSLNILDLCAAPGGKSTHIASLMPKGSLLVSNEINRTRANILAENLIKWGNENVVVSNNDSTAFKKIIETFDVIVADVPCSGEGMFRKDIRAVEEWSLDNVKMCASRQREIISAIWPSLRPGGCLVYSTCTYNTLENEENIKWICENFEAESLELNISDFKGVSPAISGFDEVKAARFFPDKIRGEGFFISLIRKKGDTQVGEQVVRKSKSKNIKLAEGIKKYIVDSDDFEFITDWNNKIYAIRNSHSAILQLLNENLKILHYGVCIGEMKQKDFIPDISLALSFTLNKNEVCLCDIDKDSAISYLRKESIMLPENVSKGWVVVTYNNQSLGWVKNLGNRSNNAWPNEWRIRT